MGNCIGLGKGKDAVEVVELQSPLAQQQSPPTAAKKGARGSKPLKSGTVGTAASRGGDSFVDVLFFPDPGMPCKNFQSEKGCTRKNCKKIHDEGSSLLTLLDYLNNCKKTMDICVFTITCDEIAECVLAAHERGVVVRVISDDDMAKGKGSDIQKFIDAGITVRDDNSRTYMHNKFLSYSAMCLFLSPIGSFNWSRQAVVGNQENLVINAGGPIIRRFRDQFEKLWQAYDR